MSLIEPFPLLAEPEPTVQTVLATLTPAQRRCMEQALRAGDEQLLSHVEASPLAVIEWDGSFVVTRWAGTADRMFGWTAADAVGKRLDELRMVHPDDADAVEGVLQRLAGGSSRQLVLSNRNVRKDGRCIHCTWYNSALFDDAGRLASVLSLVLEDTQRVEAEQALLESEERIREQHAELESIYRNAPVGLLVLDRSLRYVRINERLAEINGMPVDAHIGRPVAELLPSLFPAIRQIVESIVATGQPVKDREVTGSTPAHPGEQRTWKASYYPLRDANGEIVAFSGVVEDVTERTRAQVALEQSEQRLALALEAGQLGFWDWNIVTGQVLFGGCFESMLGYRRGDLEPNVAEWSRRIHPDDLARVNAVLSEHLAGRSDFYECEHRLRHRDGSWRWILDRGRVVERDEERRPIRAVGTHADVTARRGAEEALRAADRRKDEFLATLAHELRNPLAPIANAVQILNLKGPPDPTLQAARDVISRQLQHTVRLVDDLLDVSRITRGKLELRRERVTLGWIVEQALEASRPHIEHHSHRLLVSMPDEALYLDVDVVRIAQVLSNLLNNAAKYTEPGGQIELACAREGGEVLIAVRDNGIGIAPEQLPRVFEMFSQEVAALDRAQGGLGIGLALARGIVEMHGGRVEARSAGRGKGSEFVVRIPLLDEPPLPMESVDVGTTLGGIAPLRVLVVDDSRDNAESLALLLRFSGHAVEVAHDGSDALDVAERQRPEVILLDLGMPKMNGYAVCRALRERSWTQATRIVAVTGWGQAEDRRRTQEAGFDAHLVKPVSLPALSTLLARAARPATRA